jgi:ATP-binding cassette, subfamily B (MDR/TAP), member 1
LLTLCLLAEKIHKAVIATRDFLRLANVPTDTDESKGSFRAPIAGSIAFDHVRFAYPTRPDVPVLDDFSLKIKYGESVAVVGTSGSGKSTVVSLLQRLYEPQQGKISIGQNQLWSTDVKHLRRNISVVSQNPYLIDASVSDNIIYGDKLISPADAQRAARAANAHDFIMSLPQGYDTNVGENAALLSGGQSQRISIARALVRPSKVLILDECTSALDSVNQAAVLEAVQGAREGRTVIMVTHKLQVMQQCDRIVVLDQGRVAEEGSYEQLMQRKGVFAMLASGGEWSG